MRQLANGQMEISGTTKAEAKWALGFEHTLTGSKHFQIIVTDKSGKQHVLGEKGGFRREYLQQKFSQRGNMGGILAGIIEDIYGEDSGIELEDQFQLLTV